MKHPVGEGTYYAEDLNVLKYDPSESVTIGKYCSIATGVTLFCGGGHRTSLVSTWPFDGLIRKSGNHASRSYKRSKPTVIGNDVWIAHGATIMPGLTIGDGAVIGPCAVVFDDVPAYAVVRGNPAEVARYRFRSRVIIEAMRQIAWWDWPAETIRERVEDFYLPVEQFVEKYR